jgi:hypothetical protein
LGARDTGSGRSRRHPREEDPVKYEEFLDAVAEHASVSRDDARRYTEAVLETLAERVTGGEAEDVAAQLPPEMKGLMMRDRHAPAVPFDEREFMRKVAIGRLHAPRGLDRGPCARAARVTEPWPSRPGAPSRRREGRSPTSLRPWATSR